MALLAYLRKYFIVGSSQYKEDLKSEKRKSEDWFDRPHPPSQEEKPRLCGGWEWSVAEADYCGFE